MSHRLNWDHYWLMLAKMTASRSTCCSRKVGAIIVKNNQLISSGYNGSLPNQPHCSDDPNGCFRRYTKTPDNVKYDVCRASHAEANAIALAAKHGISTVDSVLYCTLSPCITCSKLIIMSGIKRVVTEIIYESENKDRDNLWLNFLTENNIPMETIKIDTNEIINFLTNETSKRKF